MHFHGWVVYWLRTTDVNGLRTRQVPATTGKQQETSIQKVLLRGKKAPITRQSGRTICEPLVSRALFLFASEHSISFLQTVDIDSR